jgi:hypothetical protein
VELLEVGLTESLLVASVVRIGAVEKNPVALLHDLALDECMPLLGLSELEAVGPNAIPRELQFDLDRDGGVLSGVERTDLRHASSLLDDGELETALRVGDVPQESDGIEEVGFPRCVGADEENAPLEGDVDAEEVPPVLELDTCEFHRGRPPLYPIDGNAPPCSARTVVPRLFGTAILPLQ